MRVARQERRRDVLERRNPIGSLESRIPRVELEDLNLRFLSLRHAAQIDTESDNYRNVELAARQRWIGAKLVARVAGGARMPLEGLAEQARETGPSRVVVSRLDDDGRALGNRSRRDEDACLQILRHDRVVVVGIRGALSAVRARRAQ